MLTLFLYMVSLAAAAPRDGFVLTQWGNWTHEQAVSALDQAASVGAKHVTVLMHLCQEKKSDSAIYWCDARRGETLRQSYQGKRAAALFSEFRARGLSIDFIPFPKAADSDTRQWLWPDDRRAWFKSYGDRMVELAALATEAGATDFVVGSELTFLFTDDRGWREVIKRVRRVFTGHLTISPVFAQYPMIGFWDALDSIGVSAYFPLALEPDASPSDAKLERAWRTHQRHLKEVARRYGKPITFIEVGYPTTNVAATMPWDFEWDKRTLNQELPARCWDAFRKVWSGDPDLRSFRIWGLTGQLENPKSFTPIGKPAESVVRRLFSERVR